VKACANEPKPPREVALDSDIDVVRESPLALDEERVQWKVEPRLEELRPALHGCALPCAGALTVTPAGEPLHSSRGINE